MMLVMVLVVFRIGTQMQGIKRGGAAAGVGVPFKVSPCGIQQPLSIGKLMRPHDVEEGGAKCLQGLAWVCYLIKFI